MMEYVLIGLLAFGAPIPLVAPPDATEEIVIFGEKMRNWRGSIRSNEAGTRCRTRQSTGDAELDAIGCAAMLACVPRVQPIFAQAAEAAQRRERRRLEAAASAEFTACVEGEHDRLLADLAEQRYHRRVATDAPD